MSYYLLGRAPLNTKIRKLGRTGSGVLLIDPPKDPNHWEQNSNVVLCTRLRHWMISYIMICSAMFAMYVLVLVRVITLERCLTSLFLIVKISTQNTFHLTLLYSAMLAARCFDAVFVE